MHICAPPPNGTHAYLCFLSSARWSENLSGSKLSGLVQISSILWVKPGETLIVVLAGIVTPPNFTSFVVWRGMDGTGGLSRSASLKAHWHISSESRLS